jgi:hypothetical protein
LPPLPFPSPFPFHDPFPTLLAATAQNGGYQR